MFDLIPGAAGLEAQITPESDIIGLVKGLLSQAEKYRQRRTLVFAGEPSWCRSVATLVANLYELKRVTWVTSETQEDIEAVLARDARKLLGQERGAIVYDAHSGFDPDAFGAVSGVICGGGLMILLCPPLQEWDHVPDPASERIAISPFHFQDISGRFIRRFVSVLNSAMGVCIVEKGMPLPSLSLADHGSMPSSERKPASKMIADDICRTNDQKNAVEAIEHVVRGHRRRPVVLVSDRGRGKTAALGIAAAKLLSATESGSKQSRGSMRIVVTAAHRPAVDTLFLHAQQLLPTAEVHENGLTWKQSCIQYITPDELCASDEVADLVMVDEAAAIPTSILTSLLENHSRIVFATTVHGYEGAGRGFAIRFRQTLDQQTPQWCEVMLKQPVRWAEEDPLERLVFNALLLDAEGADDNDVIGTINEDVVIECLDRDALVDDEQTLSQLFGLLVSAHYQTSPNDLRNLLDGPGVSIYVMKSGTREKKHVIATVLVSAEGCFDEELADAIFNGERRPRGHLIPQSLVTHMGIRQAASLRCARVMRIAVHPVLQHQGLGTLFIRYVKNSVERDGFDLLGTSFGATPELLRFWKALDMLPVRVGFRRDIASGEHSVMMLLPLGQENSEGHAVVREAREKFCTDLPHWLSDGLNDMESSMVLELLQGMEYQVDGKDKKTLSHSDLQMLEGFVSGARSYEDCSAGLWRFLLSILSSTGDLLQDLERSALVAKVIQKRPWEEVVTLCGCSGRREVIVLLRSGVERLLQQHS